MEFLEFKIKKGVVGSKYIIPIKLDLDLEDIRHSEDNELSISTDAFLIWTHHIIFNNNMKNSKHL